MAYPNVSVINRYLKGQGLIMVADIDTDGTPDPETWIPLGDMTSAELQGATDSFTFKENVTGNHNTVVNLNIGSQFTLSLALRNFHQDIVALALLGTKETVSSGSVAAFGEDLPAGLVVNDLVQLDNEGRITSLALQDSAGSPVALVEDEDYSHDGYGGITILNVTGFTQPFSAQYSFSSIVKVKALSQSAPNKYVRIRLLNEIYKNADGTFKQKHIDFFNAQVSVAQTIPLINERDISNIPIQLAINPSPYKPANNQFFEVLYLDGTDVA